MLLNSSKFRFALSAAVVAFSLPLTQAMAASGLQELTVDRSTPDAANRPDAPMLVTVSIDQQELKLYRGTQELARSRVSSGKKGHATPLGVFSVLEKKRYHRSNIYSNAPMPYMQRLTWSGIALHASNSVPSWPASHGCVRLPNSFADDLFAMTERGMHVVIAREEVSPRPLSHSFLFQPREQQEIALAALRETVVAMSDEEADAATQQAGEPSKPLRLYVTRITRREITAHLQAMLNRLGHEAGEEDGLYGRETAAAVIRFQKDQGLPPTGMLSDELVAALEKASATGPLPAARLYARQGHVPLFEVPVDLKDPHLPLGSHLFLAGGSQQESRLEWYSVSMATRIPQYVLRDHDLEVEDPRQQLRTPPRATLDRLAIPDETRNRIAELIVAGSSLAVSDNGLGTETGKGTDFIVQLH